MGIWDGAEIGIEGTTSHRGNRAGAETGSGAKTGTGGNAGVPGWAGGPGQFGRGEALRALSAMTGWGTKGRGTTEAPLAPVRPSRHGGYEGGSAHREPEPGQVPPHSSPYSLIL